MTSVIPDYRPPTTPAAPAYTPPPGYAPGIEQWRVAAIESANLAIASRASLAATAQSASKQQLSVAALDALVPVPYGKPRLGAMIANVLMYSGDWVFWVIWCEGPVDTITAGDLTLNDAAIGAGITATHYTGTTTQTLDATLAAAFTANGKTFTDPLHGICYSVIRCTAASMTAIPRWNLALKGRKVYDPRDGGQTHGTASTYLWSDNPALILADYLENATWGAGGTLDWSTVETVADACDATVGGEAWRKCDILIDREASVENWIETLRTAAGCFLVQNQGTYKLIADADGSPVETYSHAAGQIIGIENARLADPSTLPTVIEVTYSDNSTNPWRDATTTPVTRAGVDAGTTPYRKSIVAMQWITRATQAAREAAQRLNKLWLRGVTFDLHLFDEGLKHEPGDIIAVTHPEFALDAAEMRVLSCEATPAGWRLACEKHDDAAYSTDVEEEPSVPALRPIDLYITADATDYDAFTEAGSPTDKVAVTITINAGVTVSGNPPLTTSGFASGSTVTTINNGTLLWTLSIAADTADYNLFTTMSSPGTDVNVRLTINSGKVVYGASYAALRIGAFTTGSTIEVVNHGTVCGFSGPGGDGINDYGGGSGGNAGDAIDCSAHGFTVDNTDGYIFGGGGGGGGGNANGANGGGGGGAGRGRTGAGGGAGGTGFVFNGDGGEQGTFDAAGYGGAGGGTAYAGGDGGDWGQDGNAGGGSGWAGGSAGYAIRTGGKTVTWTGGNDGTHVKGTVG